MKKIMTFALMVALANGALAHSKIEETTPANGATITTVPAEIGLNFSKNIRLTRIEMAHEEHSAVSLDLGDQTSFDQAFTIPLPSNGTGTYVIEWRGLGEDGHAMQGAFSFTVE
ncbi:copper resistance CopC family protein [Ruegeria sp. HKCCD6428]|uniref:copper resistance CopC family protein n=1 Tax=Ruegeria sp. HKCCD6428 TaxID=2683002 RepID=UPI001491D5DA|nr:copper resistance CopC family protein [Ruegeria sp. HKCCD6428]NOC83614.1 copper resistance protein CopC [Ruegeria sp. HKCCD6428]